MKIKLHTSSESTENSCPPPGLTKIQKIFNQHTTDLIQHHQHHENPHIYTIKVRKSNFFMFTKIKKILNQHTIDLIENSLEILEFENPHIHTMNGMKSSFTHPKGTHKNSENPQSAYN